jgi:hypothetical protein
MTNGTLHLSQDPAGFSLARLTWASLRGLVAHSLDRGALPIGMLGSGTGQF